MANQHHVVPNKNKGWCVKKDNVDRASACFETKKMAMTHFHPRDNKI